MVIFFCFLCLVSFCSFCNFFCFFEFSLKVFFFDIGLILFFCFIVVMFGRLLWLLLDWVKLFWFFIWNLFGRFFFDFEGVGVVFIFVICFCILFLMIKVLGFFIFLLLCVVFFKLDLEILFFLIIFGIVFFFIKCLLLLVFCDFLEIFLYWGGVLIWFFCKWVFVMWFLVLFCWVVYWLKWLLRIVELKILLNFCLRFEFVRKLYFLIFRDDGFWLWGEWFGMLFLGELLNFFMLRWFIFDVLILWIGLLLGDILFIGNNLEKGIEFGGWFSLFMLDLCIIMDLLEWLWGLWFGISLLVL